MPKLTEFKALLFDVDKTLTNSKKEASLRTQAALKKLTSANYITAVCTGRSYPSLKKSILGLFPTGSLHVVCGGGQIIRSDGTVVWQNPISAKIIDEICAKADQLHESYCIPFGNYCYANEKMIRTYTSAHALVPPMKPFAELHNHETPILPTLNISETFMQYLRSRNDITVKEYLSYSGELSCDITAAGVTKATGLREWCQLNGLRMNQIIGFGDSDNDIEYLERVGFSVAMGNATEAIKNISNHVIGHTNEDGLAIYLENLLEGADL